MMRITLAKSPDGRTTLRLEGSLVSEWADLLELESFALLHKGVRFDLDLTDVDFVDRLGVETLRRLAGRGLEMRCRYGAVASVLEAEGVPVATVPDPNGRNHQHEERR